MTTQHHAEERRNAAALASARAWASIGRHAEAAYWLAKRPSAAADVETRIFAATECLLAGRLDDAKLFMTLALRDLQRSCGAEPPSMASLQRFADALEEMGRRIAGDLVKALEPAKEAALRLAESLPGILPAPVPASSHVSLIA